MSYEEFMNLYMSTDFGKRNPLNIKISEEGLSELYKIVDHNLIREIEEYKYQLIDLKQLKTNNMNPETRTVLENNLETQSDILDVLKQKKERLIQELCDTQNQIEVQAKRVCILRDDLYPIIKTTNSSSALENYADKYPLGQAGLQASINKQQENH